MKLALVLALLTAAVCARPLPAHAIAACNNNDGLSPRTGTKLPPHARLLAFRDSRGGGDGYVARIDGKVVPLKITSQSSSPYQMEVLDTLAIAVGNDTPAILAHVKIRRDAQSAWRELDVPVHPSTGSRRARRSSSACSAARRTTASRCSSAASISRSR